MKKTTLLSLLTTTVLAATSSAAFAVPNVAFVKTANGNVFATNLNTAPDSTGSNTLYSAETGGTGNDSYIDMAAAQGSLSNTAQYGSTNKIYNKFNTGTTNSTVQTFQGNSPEAAAINKFAVAVANNNYSNTNVGGDKQNVLTVQKGEQNVAVNNAAGGNNSVQVIQEMREVANGDIVDGQGNHYKGGNDSVVTATGQNVSVNVNQYNGNVSKVAAEGAQITTSVKQVNTLFDFNRKYNNVAVVNQKGGQLSASIDQNGAGELASIMQEGLSHNASVTQVMGGGNAVLNQAGESHKIIVSQDGPDRAFVTQKQTHNEATITQTHGSGVSGATGVTGATGSGTVTTLAGTYSLKGNNVTLPQDGNGNKAVIIQKEHDAIQSLRANTVNGATSGANLVPGPWHVTPLANVGIIVTYPNANDQVWQGQKGDNNVLNVNQFGLHDVYFQQVGNSNNLTVNQVGDMSYARVNQVGNSNSASVTQTGYSANGQNSVNMVDFTQQGDGNTLNVNQNQPLSGVGNSNHFFGQTKGSGNSVNVKQVGSGHITYYATGNNNQYTVDSTGPLLPAPGLESTYAVTGSDNKMSLINNGQSNVNLLNLEGNGNKTAVNQQGNFNWAVIDAKGNNHNLTINQAQSGAGKPLASFSQLTVSLRGEGNTMGIGQWGYGNEAHVNAHGTNNNVVVSQYSDVTTSGNLSSVGIEGDFNTIQQHSVGGNHMLSQAVGNNNYIYSSSVNTSNNFASRNIAQIGLTGNNNRGTIGQTGINNIAGIDVTGNNHVADIQQNGNNNNAQILVTAAATTPQNLQIVQNGNNQSLKIVKP